MATFLNGILGGFSGKVGTVIGSNWNGIEYMRSRAANITQPNTQAQLEQRAKFSTVGKFLRPMLHFLRIGYKNQAIKMSAYNAAMSHTLENALAGVYPNYTVDYPNVQVSQGFLPEVLNPLAVSIEAGKIDFSWDDNSNDPGADATDIALLVVYCPELQKAVTSITGGTRAIQTQTLTLPTIFSGHEVECYVSFADAKKEVISNSQHVGGVMIL